MIASFPMSPCTSISLGAGYKNSMYILDIPADKNSLGGLVSSVRNIKTNHFLSIAISMPQMHKAQRMCHHELFILLGCYAVVICN